MKVLVYHFRVYDGINDKLIIPVRKSTAPRIANIGGEIIQGTGEEVDVTALDEQDRYDPRPEQKRGA